MRYTSEQKHYFLTITYLHIRNNSNYVMLTLNWELNEIWFNAHSLVGSVEIPVLR